MTKWLLIWIVASGTGPLAVSLPEGMTFPTAAACKVAADAVAKLDSLGVGAKATCIEVQVDTQAKE